MTGQSQDVSMAWVRVMVGLQGGNEGREEREEGKTGAGGKGGAKLAQMSLRECAV